MPKLGSDRVRIFIKFAALIVLLLSAPLAWSNLARQAPALFTRFPPAHGNGIWLYWIGFAIGIVAIVATPFLNSATLRVLSALTILPGYIFERTAVSIGALEPNLERMTYDLLHLCWTELGSTSAALEAYGNAAIPYLIIGSVFLFGSAISPPKKISLPNVFFFVLPLAFFVTAFVAQKPYSYLRFVFPAPYNVPAYLLRVVMFEKHYTGNKDQISIVPTNSGVPNIVFILDESVRGDFISLNRPTLDDTPYLTKAAKEGVSYGIATSIANCSAASRLALRAGARTKDLPDRKDKTLHKSTFWQYARGAGYKTIYLNAFAHGFMYHSYMNSHEAKFISKQYPFKPEIEVDNKVAERIKNVLADPGKKFIFVEKYGVHYPHDGHNAPPNYEYEPKGINTLPMRYSQDQRAVVREYLRSIRWRVDEFFEKLGDTLRRPDILIIYSSDHGQNMFENGTKGQHCDGPNASRGEAEVPLLAFSGDATLLAKLRRNSDKWYNMASAEVIFPTLLVSMGYEPTDVNRLYGPSLFDAPVPMHRYFMARDLWGTKKIIEIQSAHAP
ncbi:sulfatase-like hydrolase/transferase [Hyphomicrobium sp.]|jgi:glucan phosphoethanolaminetransferase (alkaline phosphatase superfamily)|uniref:sulfatase-like hydrolase/transferase n=1 Tax=Hyphomicrobium sp. TaxID=82 RepID=UPI002B6A4AA8|nr:sulfatase-like hydrolase/transferase [Hyphomicrobium sp.]HVZ03753.1 sulfatase-like hydrolase/transferase [Hyphomicrobium sp.]